MLTINGTSRTNCSGVTRRELLQIGGAGLFGMTLPGLLAAQEAQQAFAGGKAKSVIFLFLFGGPSQLETFDMKPDAKREVRGPFKPIKSQTPDLLISEHLGRLAKISDKYAVIRSMTHTYNDHSGAGHYLQTGHRWHLPVGGGFSATPQDWPSMGSVVEHLGQKLPGGMERDLASYAVLPNRLGKLQDRGQYIRPGEYAGWLGQAYNPMTTVIDKKEVKDNPYWRACADGELSYEIEGLKPVIPVSRIQERVGLLDQFEAVRTRLDMGDGDAMDLHRKRAMALISSDKTSSALNIRAEAESMRDRYGRHLFGQSCLMARRLVEAGTRFVTVHYDCPDGYGWDSHRNSDDVRDHLLPTFDQGCSALLTDLDERGLLDETLVIAIGEMGRTPIPNATWGRGHWSTCFPALIAGAGVRGGIVYGKSDKEAAYPDDKPVSPEDLAKTINWSLGIDPDLMLTNRENRPIPIVDGGKPVMELFG
ncbi:MAG: DUF1501 domain-containing protein [Prosthecobacter sp.]|uniref:DUF1501 domain-containing protein n=1 Tax=Prosthecobacter sp. TaxID=1965333 RepID=UPI003901640E